METLPPIESYWLITLKHPSGKIKEVKMPGGLFEPEAVRCAVLQAGGYWRSTGASLKVERTNLA